MIRLVTLFLLLSWCIPAAAASFDCTKARSSVEKAICSNPEVSTLDEHLARYYAAAKTTLGRAGECLQTDQLRWLRHVRDVCTDAACLKKTHLERLSELDALQPGASALKSVQLPRVTTIVWIVPPAADEVAAPPKQFAKSFSASGRMINEVATGDGFVLQTADGTKHILLLTMLLDGPTDARLEALAKDAKATFLARGYEAKDSAGKVYFEPSRCTFLYRLP
jgi:uncharacterized protein